MIMKRNRKEWEQLVNDYVPGIESQRAYCEGKAIKYRSFRHWYYKLKLKPAAELRKKGKTELRDDKSDDLKQQEVGGFIGFKLGPIITKVSLPNGINIEVASGNISELIKILYHVV